MDPDKAYIEHTGIRLTKKLAEGLEQGVISEDEASEIATYILDNIDKSDTSAKLLDFIEDLAQKWPIFQGVLVLEQGEVNKQNEDSALQKASELIKQNDVEGALNVAEQATNQKTGGNE